MRRPSLKVPMLLVIQFKVSPRASLGRITADIKIHCSKCGELKAFPFLTVT